ncbi:MAG TPA: hypothetical protein VFS00_23495 [Polyangiaceae bacterium]|nr:hypothetical protein [Polyangiaceae bacterium]
MYRAARALFGLAPLAATAAFATGCMSASAYTVPRAIEPGKVTVGVAPEVTFVSDKREGENGLPDRKDTRLAYLAVPPTVAVRVGLGADVDLGLALRSGFVPGVDVKYNFYKSESLDLAVRPGLQGFATPGDASSGSAVYPSSTGK